MFRFDITVTGINDDTSEVLLKLLKKCISCFSIVSAEKPLTAYCDAHPV